MSGKIKEQKRGSCGMSFRNRYGTVSDEARPTTQTLGEPRREPIMRVLLVEDYKPLVRALRQSLEEEGFAVDVATDGTAGDLKAHTAEYDVIILDIMLPKTDGLQLLRRWRKKGLTSPVLVLTARGSLEDKVKGLDLGADDYMTKPFELEALPARLRALIRRGQVGRARRSTIPEPAHEVGRRCSAGSCKPLADTHERSYSHFVRDRTRRPARRRAAARPGHRPAATAECLSAVLFSDI